MRSIGLLVVFLLAAAMIVVAQQPNGGGGQSIDDRFAEVWAAIDELRADLTAVNATLTADIAALRSDLADLRADHAADVQALNDSIAWTRALHDQDMLSLEDALRAEISALDDSTTARANALESRLDTAQSEIDMLDARVTALEGGTVADTDGDGYNANVDCNDNDPAINPGATEVCDGVDNTCDGVVDEGCGGATCDASELLLVEDFSSAEGWTLGPDWQVGAATGSSGQSYGYPDPASDHTATSDDGVAGVVIGGNAPTALHDYHWLTSPAVDASGTAPTLRFFRWLNSDYSPYMTNRVEVFDGTAWQTLWQSGSSSGVADNAWTQQDFDLSAYANPELRVRFGYQVGSAGALQVSQWNLDDVTIAPTHCLE